MSETRVFVVTDPMCSWCWGMATAVEEAAHQLAGEVTVDLLLGGINIEGTQPIGEFGRRHLMKLWHEVRDTTGQTFGFTLPEPFVYNSTLACIAVEAVRRRSGQPPFGFLHRLQQSLFVEGRNINDADELARVAGEFGWVPDDLHEALVDDEVGIATRAQFESARIYGTNALPNVVIETGGERRLLFGGYADSEMMVSLVRQQLGRSAGSAG